MTYHKVLRAAVMAVRAGAELSGLLATTDLSLSRNGMGPRRAYRAQTANGSLVLCDRHLDLLRARETAKLTGEEFEPGLCDHCEDEMERSRR